ncbi:MAG TPA: hypothetical protein VFT50_07070 [Baekduia sp.]|nr:hypothetical protein [Baekduia sp.]
MTVRTTLAIAATGLAALTGCGAQDATDAAQQQAGKAKDKVQQQRQDLSPQAQRVLQQSQALAGDVATTAKGYASQDVTSDEAQAKLGDYQQRAADLADQAQSLPATDKAKSRLTELTQQIQQTTQTLGDNIQGSAGDGDLQTAVDDLRSTASDTYNQLRGKVPADARQKIDDALKALGA